MPNDNFIDLDIYHLETEWQTQPRLYHDHALILAECAKEAKEAKAQLELVEAELDYAVRQVPSEFGLDPDGKITETLVKGCVTRHSKYQIALKKKLDADYREDVAKAAVRALDHRRDALENEVKLRLADYFSEPRIPRANEEEQQFSRDQKKSAARDRRK